MQQKAFIEFAGWVYHACGHNTNLALTVRIFHNNYVPHMLITDCQMSRTPVH